MPELVRSCAFACGVLLTTVATHAEPPRPVFYAYDLGLDYANVAGINASGQIVGDTSDTGGSTKGFITGPNGVGFTWIARLNGAFATPTAVNAAGQVVGVAGGKPFITGPNGSGIRELAMPVPGYQYATATAINDQGQVAGWYQATTPDGSTVVRSFITDPDGIKARPLDGLNPTGSWAYDINHLGQVVGLSQLEGSGAYRSFVTGPNGSGVKDIGTGGGLYARVGAINDRGQIGGQVVYPTGKYEGDYSHSFTAEPGQALKLKKNFGGGSGSVVDINERGEYAGFATTEYDIGRAYVAVDHGKPTDLNALVVNLPQGVILRYPAGINDARQLAVSARVLPNSKVRVYIVCPTVNCQ